MGVENTAEDTDLVIEAVFEDFDIEAAVFNALDEACGDSTILASNTSSLSVNARKLAGRADQFVGLHFFTTQPRTVWSRSFPPNPPVKKPLTRSSSTTRCSGKW